jgi:hypothetical protein
MLLRSSKLALASAFLASASLVAPTAAEAGWRYRHSSYGYGYHAPAYYGGHYPAYNGYGHPYGYPVYRKRRSNRGAIAAALIGGIALGAILASSQRAYGRSCVAHRRAYTHSGRPYLRRVRVC